MLCIPPPLLCSCLPTFSTAQIQAAKAQTYFWKGCLLHVGLVKHNPRTLTVKAVQNNACAICTFTETMLHLLYTEGNTVTGKEAHIASPVNTWEGSSWLHASSLHSKCALQLYEFLHSWSNDSIEFHVLPCQVSCPKVSLPSSGHHR